MSLMIGSALALGNDFRIMLAGLATRGCRPSPLMHVAYFFLYVTVRSFVSFGVAKFPAVRLGQVACVVVAARVFLSCPFSNFLAARGFLRFPPAASGLRTVACACSTGPRAWHPLAPHLGAKAGFFASCRASGQFICWVLPFFVVTSGFSHTLLVRGALGFGAIRCLLPRLQNQCRLVFVLLDCFFGGVWVLSCPRA